MAPRCGPARPGQKKEEGRPGTGRAQLMGVSQQHSQPLLDTQWGPGSVGWPASKLSS